MIIEIRAKNCYVFDDVERIFIDFIGKCRRETVIFLRDIKTDIKMVPMM